MVQEPLQRFYDALNDDQKHRFETMGSSGRRERRRPAATSPRCAGSRRTMQPTCRSSASPKWCSRTANRSKARSRRSSRHRATPRARCRLPAPNQCRRRRWRVSMPSRPGSTAMVEAMKIIQPKLQDFYPALSDEQKAKFNIMGPAQSAASGARRRTSKKFRHLRSFPRKRESRTARRRPGPRFRGDERNESTSRALPACRRPLRAARGPRRPDRARTKAPR